MIALGIALAVLAVPVLLASAYLFLLAAASRRPPVPAAAAARLPRFDLIVPAHEEEAGIARTVRSLLQTDYPPELRRVIVVAHNCSDATAARAEAAGATVLVHDDRCRRGKGYALAAAFEHTLESGFADAAVVVDADSLVSPNLLRAFSARLQGGALAIQSGSAVLNAGDSWRTQLMALGLALFNGVRSLARENLGLSCGLRGNGMCLAVTALREHPYRAFSLVEDLEYGIVLGRAGVRIRYAHEAVVASAMVSSGTAAATQRRRWELGRARLARVLVPSLLRDALRTRSILLLDLAVDLLVPPLSFLALAVASGSAASVALRWISGAAAAASSMWLLSGVFLALYLLRGWQLADIGIRGARAMASIPFYVGWKIAVLLRSTQGGNDQWVRTAREEGLR
jgi:1,2-diacylglycerol 3-beta-glucosyltransferase